jgi:hypothetical protein
MCRAYIGVRLAGINWWSKHGAPEVRPRVLPSGWYMATIAEDVWTAFMRVARECPKDADVRLILEYHHWWFWCGAGGNRTPVHKSYATRSTYVATSIVLTAHYPTGRESAQPAR